MTFAPEQVFCVLDYETYSEAPLKRVGGFEYSIHPSTEILCAAWRVGTRDTLAENETSYWAPLRKDDIRQGWQFHSLVELLSDPSIIIIAHNAYFEQVIIRNVLGRKIANHTLQNLPSSRFLCTASLAAALALPRNLEGAARVLKLAHQKDMAGHRLMLKWAKPRKPTKNDQSTRQSDPDEYEQLVSYCVADINAEVDLFLKVPPLTPTERQVWLLDQAINLRGFYTDRPLVKTVLKMISQEVKELDRETVELTGSEVSSATKLADIKSWLEAGGVFLPNMQKKTVEDAIADGLVKGDAKRMLEIRQAVSKTSTAKYQAFEMRSRHDGRVRDILVYHTASTGRWGGAGVQPQNFPRGNVKDTGQLIQIMKSGGLELTRLVYGDPMTAFSSCLRGMIIPPKGKVFDVADYSAIEARVLFWVANHEAGLQAFRDKRDLYKELATKIFGVKIEKVSDSQRFVGKQATLGSGFGMGPEKFQATCKNLGQEVSEALAKTAIGAYRETHRPVTVLWKMIERAAIAAVENPGTKYSINHTKWWVKNGFLWCQLPSGRRLAYHGPAVRWELPKWGGAKRPVLYHWGLDPKTHKWVNSKTYGGRLVENVVQAVARDVMAEAMLRIEGAGPWQLVLTVHDELIAERDVFSTGTHEAFIALMKEVPGWAEGLPIAVEGWEGRRYRK